MKTWRTIRVYVDVPVRGDIREKDIVWGVQAAIDAGYHHLKRRAIDGVAYGRVRAKAASKVKAHEDWKEQRELERERAAGKWV